MASTETKSIERIDEVTCAKMVRAILKEKFPKTTFSVRVHKYAGGSSINVRWAYGPCTARVERAIGAYHGAEFDGMTDMKTHHDTAIVSGGKTKMVHFANDYIHTTRDCSDSSEFSAAQELIYKHCHVDRAKEGERDPGRDIWCGERVSDCVNAVINGRDYELETLEEAVERIVIKRAEIEEPAEKNKQAMLDAVACSQSLAVPTVHPNGTWKTELMSGYSDAIDSLRNARRMLAAIAPHGRDYVQTPDGYAKARAQHDNRLKLLEQIQQELQEIMEKVYEQ